MAPDEVSAELDAVQVVRLTLVFEPHLLQIFTILPWHNFPKQKCKFWETENSFTHQCLECSEHMMVDMGALNSQNKDDRLELFQQLQQGNPGHYWSNVSSPIGFDLTLNSTYLNEMNWFHCAILISPTGIKNIFFTCPGESLFKEAINWAQGKSSCITCK